MPYVQSSAISRIEHDEQTQTLSIWFKGSRRYDYYGVPKSVYQALMNASSKGTYFAQHIRDRYSQS